MHACLVACLLSLTFFLPSYTIETSNTPKGLDYPTLNDNKDRPTQAHPQTNPNWAISQLNLSSCMTVGLTMTSNQDGHQGAKKFSRGQMMVRNVVRILNSKHVMQTGIHKEYKGSLQYTCDTRWDPQKLQGMHFKSTSCFSVGHLSLQSF